VHADPAFECLPLGSESRDEAVVVQGHRPLVLVLTELAERQDDEPAEDIFGFETPFRLCIVPTAAVAGIACSPLPGSEVVALHGVSLSVARAFTDSFARARPWTEQTEPWPRRVLPPGTADETSRRVRVPISALAAT